MNLNALHRRLLQDVLETGNAFPFVITGGYAVQAHGLVDRLSRDIDVATNSSVPMASLADHLGEDCEVDILKEGFNRPPAATKAH